MTPELKQRIEQLRVGKVPIGYKSTRYGVYPNDWAIKNVGACINEYRELTNDIHSFPVYSSSRKGLIPQSEYYDQKDAKETNIGYKIVPANYVTYRHMSDDDVFHFNINHTGSSILVSSEYPVFATKKETDTIFLVSVLNSTARFRYFCRAQKLGGTRTRLYLQKLSQYQFGIPNFQEQGKISTILSAQDKVIELKEKRLAEKQRQKKYLMQQLLTGKKRLSDFTVPWATASLGNLFSERKETNCDRLQLLAITGTQGVIPRSELDLKDNSSEDKSKYLKICVGDIGYNTMRMWQGVSAYSDYEGIVSPAYTILKPIADIDAKYFSYLFKLPGIVFLFYRFSQGLVDDTRNLKYENFKKITVRYPSDRREQTAIAEVLSTADREIDLLRQDIEQEKQKKKALMQLLLTGIVRATPCH